MGPLDSRRVVGVDVARCLALVGMMATHVLPAVVDGRVTLAQQVAAGRASALFAVLAGVSLVLVAGTRRPVRGAALRGMVVGTAVRAALIGLVGLLLGGLDAGIAVILVSYAVLFVVTVPFLALSTRALALVLAGWLVLAPVVSLLLRRHLPATTYDLPSFEALADPLAVGRDLLVTGYYPVLTWVPYLLVGLLVGRSDLAAPRTAGRLAVAGLWAVLLAWSVSEALLSVPDVRASLVATYTGNDWVGDLDATLARGLHGVTPTGSPWWLAVRAPHSGTTPDVLMTAGSACLVLAGCLVLGRTAPRVAAVAFGAGALTLSLYTLHVLLRTDGWWDGDDLPTFLGQTGLVLAIGAVVRWYGGRGPLEVLVGEASREARRAVDPR